MDVHFFLTSDIINCIVHYLATVYFCFTLFFFVVSVCTACTSRLYELVNKIKYVATLECQA